MKLNSKSVRASKAARAWDSFSRSTFLKSQLRIARILLMLVIPVALFAGVVGLLKPGVLLASTPDHHSLQQTQALAPPYSPNLQPPTNLQILSLDSTFHVKWTPSPDPLTAWHVVSVWDDNGSTLQQAKVVGRTSGAAQTNGLMPNHSYLVKVQAMDSAGNLSEPVSAQDITDQQSPMRDAAFFENFNGPAGDLNSDYFDVRTSQGTGLQPESIGTQKVLVFNNENHFHTQMIGGIERGELYIRPRVPFDFANNRTGTMQFEVDTAAVQHSEGKWFEVHLVRDSTIPWSSEEFGAGDGDDFSDSIEFSVRTGDGPSETNVNIPQITVNINGVVTTYEGTLRQLTPANVRMPVVLKVSRTSVEFLINGVSVVQASGLNLPFTRGYWYLAHRAWYASRDNRTSPVILQLIHWETIQYDGPAGSFSPVMKTYIQPGCPGVANMVHEGVEGCSELSFSPSQPTHTLTWNMSSGSGAPARTARLLYNGTANSSFTATINGHPLTIPTLQCCFLNALNTMEFPGNWIQEGNNTVVLSYNGNLGELPDLSQVEVEVVYDEPRGIPGTSPQEIEAMHEEMTTIPMLSLTTQSFRRHWSPGDPMVYTATTYLYSLGSVNPVNYSASVISTETPWLSVSPNTGTLTSPVLGGGVLPLTVTVNFNGLTTEGDGEVGVIKITGGNMPLYVAVLAIRDGQADPATYIPTFTNLNTTFNKNAIPDYHGVGNSTPTATPPGGSTPIPASSTPVVGTPNPTSTAAATNALPSATPIAATSTPIEPTATAAPTNTPLPDLCDITFSDVPRDYWAWNYITYMACNGIVSGYANGSFLPGNDVSRGQIAKIVSSSAGFSDDPGPQIFQDVDPSNTFYVWVNRLSNRGFMGGYDCGTLAAEPCLPGNLPYFRPFTNASRGQIAKIVSNTAGFADTPVDQTFEDVPATNTFYLWVERLAGRGMMSGYECGTMPQAPCVGPLNRPYFLWGNNTTRAQTSKIVYNALIDSQGP